MPSGVTSIFSAAGTLGRPGIVMMSPVSATMKPAPAETLRLRTVMRKSRGAPSLVWSSVKEYWVFATQMGRPPKPCSSSCFSCLAAALVKSTPSAW